MQYKPYPYQRKAEHHIIDHPACGLFLEMGLGKTVITLTAIDELLYNRFEVTRVLVVAPLRVAATVWAEEARKWDHLRHLRVQKVLGQRGQRVWALRQEADIYVINRENVDWLVRYFQAEWPFDMVVLDELSSFKSPQAARVKALRRVRPRICRVVGLTGTPAPNGLIDLWSQLYLLDRGERLGKTLGGYRQRYFVEGRRNAQAVFEWLPKPGAQEAIYQQIGDICISMQARDYLELPERMDQYIPVFLPPAARRAYEQLERDLLLPLAQDAVITAQTAAVAANKLLQVANGAVYDAEQTAHEIHTAKLEALEDLIEQANGQPVLVYYGYRHDVQRILKKFPEARQLLTSRDVENWNAGQYPILLAHPDSAGHGLNLQMGGHIVIWYGLTWSLEKYKQANARLHRQGQQRPVTVYHLVAQGTLDQRVLRVLAGRETLQEALMEAVKA